MYVLINDNPHFIEDLKKHFTNYKWLIDAKNREHQDFEKKYKDFWRMNAARGLANNKEFYNVYFSFIKKKKTSLDDFFNEIEDKNAGFQFSFATKAIHMGDTTKPIFDVNVKRFFYLKDIDHTKEWHDKIVIANQYYEFLQKEYKRIEEKELLKPTIDKLDFFLNLIEINPNSVSFTKKVDSIIWSWVNYLNEEGTNKNFNIWRK